MGMVRRRDMGEAETWRRGTGTTGTRGAAVWVQRGSWLLSKDAGGGRAGAWQQGEGGVAEAWRAASLGTRGAVAQAPSRLLLPFRSEPLPAIPPLALANAGAPHFGGGEAWVAMARFGVSVAPMRAQWRSLEQMRCDSITGTQPRGVAGCATHRCVLDAGPDAAGALQPPLSCMSHASARRTSEAVTIGRLTSYAPGPGLRPDFAARAFMRASSRAARLAAHAHAQKQ